MLPCALRSWHTLQFEHKKKTNAPDKSIGDPINCEVVIIEREKIPLVNNDSTDSFKNQISS